MSTNYKITRNYFLKLRNGFEFSAATNDFIFIEINKELDKKYFKPFVVFEYERFIKEMLVSQKTISCLWLIESPTRLCLKVLSLYFPNSKILNGSIAGTFENNLENINLFFKAYQRVFNEEKWTNEANWALIGLSKLMPEPIKKSIFFKPHYSYEYIILNHECVDSIFFQADCAGIIGVRNSNSNAEKIKEHFLQNSAK